MPLGSRRLRTGGGRMQWDLLDDCLVYGLVFVSKHAGG